MADVCSLCCNTRDAQLTMIQDDAQKGHKYSRPSDQLNYDAHVPHDIFLSHSGAQKGFVKDLYQELTRSTFSTFLDIEHHSLPPGEHFPSRILQAAKSCRVALVVLSEEFVCSKWPMVELCTFVDAMANSSGRLSLLPLFFKLSPADLKCKRNLKRWRKSWTTHAKQDGKHRINVDKWQEAVEKLCSQNGILFEKASEGEQTYIDKIVEAVSEIVPPAFTFDTTFIAGKDRLCQVILDKLESMDHHQSGRVTISSLESAPASTSSHSMVTSCVVLGLYGLPGSGKSTLCRCLVDHFRPLFPGKTLYLEFSSSPSDAEVVNKLMELRHLTNFRERVRLGSASQLEHVESLLKSCRLSACKVFLVVDNISEKTCEAVQRILHLGFGHGSKIILVAHTLGVLRKTLDSLRHQLHWAVDSMVTPGIDEMEATEILLRTSTSSYGPASDRHTLLLKWLTSRQMGTVMRIVHMCRTDGWEGGQVWLPFVMKAVGARLLKYEKDDLEGWESDLQSFWTRVRTYEQSAVVEELLGDNFKALPNEHLQVLFLDVALFILQIENKIDVVSASSMMLGISTSRIRMLIHDLERRGFLNIVSEVDGIGIVVKVHDVYMKFARSIQNGPSKDISWRWEERQIPDAESGSGFLLKENQSLEEKGKLRALVLEVGESCERVDLQGFSGLKAVMLRNCKSVVVLGLAGLGSLTILEVRNCASFGRVECIDSDYNSLLNIKRFSVNKARQRMAQRAEVGQSRGTQVLYFLQSNIVVIVNAVRRVMMAPFRQPHSLGMGFDIASKMRSLQVVHLENTGIGGLECVGGMWPQLRDLTVIEQHLQRLELGSLPKLENFLFRDVGDLNTSLLIAPMKFGHRVPDTWRRKEGDARYLLAGQDLMLGCPQLKRVRMQSSFFKQGQLGSLPAGVVSLALQYLNTATELPNLSLSVHTLEELDVMSCEKLERVNLDTGGFKRLTTLRLGLCDNIVEVNGPGSLPSLRVLQVYECSKLRILKGFGNSETLEEFTLLGLSELREVSSFSSMKKLHSLTLVCCPLGISSLCDMEKLRECYMSLILGDGECCLNLSNCKSLQYFSADCRYVDAASLAGKLVKLEGLDKLENDCTVRITPFGEANLKPLSDERDEAFRFREYNFDERDDAKKIITAAKCGLASLVELGKGCVSFDLSFLAAESGCVLGMIALGILPGGCLRSIDCDGVVNIDSIEDIGVHRATLKDCKLSGLGELRSLRGVESLALLRSLRVAYSVMLEEVPSLHTLVHLEELRIVHCPKVKAVEGCDYMTQLWFASFGGCESMERLPVFSNNMGELRELHFWGCKFSRDQERMFAWIEDKSAPNILCDAALEAAVLNMRWRP